ncbi:DUF4345 domain-containing protein [Thalassospira sp. HF15]|uniref:DUF4345 domain-containing protein n=1 Tax=Thalassospira sp. HF15 TaxID=2722755 RepID=UPI001430E14A|nr:DUF4345 domain-containing protein [Thalassospira sp. HF15]NIY75041.1 DUF4345 domain-containing protein [Thalassospira sp. HF15]
MNTNSQRNDMPSRATRVLLAVSGAIAVIIGGGLTFVPAQFQASAGVVLGPDINLLSEVRAPCGFLLAAGIMILLGAFRRQMVQLSLMLASLLYLSYAAARLVGIMMDGMPNSAILTALGVEVVLGCLCLAVLANTRRRVLAPA